MELALYVWPAVVLPTGVENPYGKNGHFGSMEAEDRLFAFAKDRGISRLIVSNNFFPPEADDYVEAMTAMIHKANKQGLAMEVLTTSVNRIEALAALPSNGIRLDLEWFPMGESVKKYEPLDPEDFNQYTLAKEAVSDPDTGKPLRALFASIGWHWGTQNHDGEIEYDDEFLQAYEHILEIVDGVDIQPGWGRSVENGGAKVIARRIRPIVEYANAISKPVWVTLSSKEVGNKNTTFFDEGEEALFAVAHALQGELGDTALLTGVAIHSWLGAYGSGADGWPVHK